MYRKGEFYICTQNKKSESGEKKENISIFSAMFVWMMKIQVSK